MNGLLYRFDPVPLRPMGVPPDEYNPETQEIPPRLGMCRSPAV
ncbi:MAG TPA: hypothetical protein VEB59_09155 [Gemmatimonadales bacterium]|nr:hypothetical protein [Gemmatimonadales bacterium]